MAARIPPDRERGERGHDRRDTARTAVPAGVDRNFVARLRERGVAVVGGIREGLGALDRLGRHAA